jgi:hypothetical protein
MKFSTASRSFPNHLREYRNYYLASFDNSVDNLAIVEYDSPKILVSNVYLVTLQVGGVLRRGARIIGFSSNCSLHLTCTTIFTFWQPTKV